MKEVSQRAGSAPFRATFRVRPEKALNNLIDLKMNLPTAGESH